MIHVPFYGLVIVPGVTYYFQKDFFHEISEKQAEEQEEIVFLMLKEDKKQLLIENTARNIAPVTENIKYRHAVHCYKADKDYGFRIADALSLDRAKVEELAKLSESDLQKATWSS